MTILSNDKSSAVAEMGDRLATIDIGRKVGAAVPLSVGGKLSPHLTNAAWEEAYLRTKWHHNPSSPLATTDMDQKLGAVPLFLGSWVPI